MPADLAVCYVGDTNFLLGSLISLRSLRRFIPSSEAEIYVFYLDPDPAVLARLQAPLARFDATILPLNIADEMHLKGKTWNKTHVPTSALGRFFLEPHLPEHTGRILYLDGDTLFVDDPRELFGYHPPDDAFAAAEDISYFARSDWGKYGAKTRSYFSGLGLAAKSGYLNSGVLFSQRETWRRVASEALQYFEHNSELCLYHDQSAINAVVRQRRVRLSPRWNFQTPFCYWGVREKLKASLLHFTEFPKPWMGEVEPWAFLAEEIREAASEFAELDLPAQRLAASEIARYNQLKKKRERRLAQLMPLRLWRRRNDIFRLARQAAV